MSNETLFYICGITLAVSAVLFSFAGLKMKNLPGRAFPIIVLWFALFVGGATTFAVLHAQDEEHAEAAELEKAGEEFESAESSGPFEEEEEAEGAEAGETADEAEGEEEPAGAEGPGGTLQLAADPSAIAYDTTSLSTEAGEVTIEFTNPAPIEHDVAIEKDGEEIAKSETITEGETSVTAELEPGTYAFYCSVPGHREAGMEGTLTAR